MILVGKVSDVPAGMKREISVNGISVLLVNQKGSIYAVEKECPHQAAPLQQAIVKDDYIACPRHGYRFKLLNGLCAEHPDFTLKTWPVVIENGEIYLEMG